MKNPVDDIIDAFIERRSIIEQTVDDLKSQLNDYNGIALYGAGSSGIAFLLALRKAGIQPICFADADPEKWGSDCMALPVIRPEDLIPRFGENILVVVCINTDGGNYCRSFREALRVGGHSGVHQKLRECGCKNVVDYIAFRRCFNLYKGDNTGNLPSCPDVDCIIEHRENIKQVYYCLSDDISRETYLNILSFRLMQEREEIYTISQKLQYFPEELFSLTGQESFVDCGAYNGITLRSVLEYTNAQIDTYYALEPDPVNYTALVQYIQTLPDSIKKKIYAIPCGAWNDNRGMNLYALHGPGSFAADYGSCMAKTDTIDQILHGAKVTAIKMNIEGSESRALTGAKDTINRWHPKLMIAGYHKTWDFWEIPESILHMGGKKYKLYLRSYMHHLSFVFYAV